MATISSETCNETINEKKINSDYIIVYSVTIREDQEILEEQKLRSKKKKKTIEKEL